MKAVEDAKWRRCPDCNSEIVGAVKNGFMVEGHSTDLMLCYDCEKLYVVYPDDAVSVPEEVDVSIEDQKEHVAGMIRNYAEARGVFDLWQR